MSATFDVFDEAVFAHLAVVSGHKLSRGRVARKADKQPGVGEPRNDSVHDVGPDALPQQRENIDALITKSMLTFNRLLNADRLARVHVLERGTRARYEVVLSNVRLAFDLSMFHDLLGEDNPGVDLTFDPELINYKPDEDLIKRSKLPLWLIKPVGGKTFLIERVWG